MSANEPKKYAQEILGQVPEEHRRCGVAAGVGAVIGGVVGSLLDGPVGAAIGGAVGVAVGEKSRSEGER